MNTLKIIEWNVARINPEKKEKEFEKLMTELIGQDADIIVLTQMATAEKKILCGLLENSDRDYSFAATSNRNYNGVTIIASKNQIEKVKFEDFIIHKDQNKNEQNSVERLIYPDALFATITLNSGKEFGLMGMRFMVYGLKTKEEKIQQINGFLEMVNKYRPRLIIGDFNWFSAIKNQIKVKKGEKFRNKEEKFCGQIKRFRGRVKKGTKQAKFEMWPQIEESSKNELYSYRTGTCPDRVIYDSSKFDILKTEYYPKDLKTEKDWPSDHAMLVMELKLLN